MIMVVLHNSENDELEMGPFNQGVVVELGHGSVITSVADSHTIARRYSTGQWFAGGSDFKMYEKVFIQQVPLDLQRRIAKNELACLVAERPHCARVKCEHHDHCIKIDLARERVDFLGEPSDA